MVSTLPREASRFVKCLFKKKATPQKIGLSFVELIIKSRESKRETSGTLSALSEKDRERVQLETMLLQGFVIEYVTAELFRDRPERLGILNAYYAVLDDLAKQDPVWRSFDNELRKRTVLYSQAVTAPSLDVRSEEHTSELQSPCNLVCRLLLEKKKKEKSADNPRLGEWRQVDDHSFKTPI